MKSILYVGYRDSAHSSAGGYDKIIGNSISDSLMGENVPFGFIPVKKRGKFLNVICLDLIARILRYKYKLVHFFYGDTMCLPYLKNKKHKVVATIHMDVKETRRFHSQFINSLKSLDGVIVLSTEQKNVLKQMYNIESVFIPHGFSDPYFKIVPININKNEINICVLGQQYRDYITIENSIVFCKEKGLNIRFHMIGQPEEFKNKISQYENVKCYSRLSDDEYFSVIVHCDYNFLPVTFSTANNALLESQFLGVKSILPKIEGILDYAAPSPLNYFYKDFSELSGFFLSCNKNKINKELISFAQKYRWCEIYKQLNAYYDSIIKVK